jgi:hypothetical protein
LYGGFSAVAADRVILKYGAFRGSILTSELTTFAKTGQISQSLGSYLSLSGQKPENVRSLLTREVKVNVVTLDWVLDNPAGNLVLDRVGLAVHPPLNIASRQAIRSALISSASRDSKVSLVEIIQSYPTPVVEVEGSRIAKVYRQISAVGGPIRKMADDLIRSF